MTVTGSPDFWIQACSDAPQTFQTRRHACYEGRRWVAPRRAAHDPFQGSCWTLLTVAEAASNTGFEVVGVHGGMKFYRGSAAAARTYVEADHSRADDYYLVEGTGLATRYVADVSDLVSPVVRQAEDLDGATYERWVAGHDVETGRGKGRLRDDANALRFVEVTVNGPKTWSLAAALYPEMSAALDAAQERAAVQIIGWVAAHATTRVGPRGRQVQVPVEQIEAAVIRHYTSRAGDPHRHLHLQINARVFAASKWRGIHSVAMRDSLEAINGIGHAAVATDPGFRSALAAAWVHLRSGHWRDPRAGDLRRTVQCAGSSNRPQRRPLRGRMACRASWRGTRAEAPASVGSAGMVTGTAGQGCPPGRSGDGRGLE